MRGAPGLAMLAALTAAPAAAQTIPWFEANQAARREVLRACRNDHALHLQPDTAARCANAEAAESRVYARRSRIRGFDLLDTPEHWRRNPGMTAALRAACDRRAGYDAPLLRYCPLLRAV